MMTSQEILNNAYPIIERLAKNRSANGSFAHYESNDVYQEVWRMCLEALERYDPNIGPIENYLVRHVTNRLKNLRRDNYFRPGFDIVSSGLARTRINLVNALPIDNGDMACNGELLCSTPISVDPIEYILYEETLEYIYMHLPSYLLDDFEQLIGNNSVRYPIVEDIRQNIDQILKDRDDDVNS